MKNQKELVVDVQLFKKGVCVCVLAISSTVCVFIDVSSIRKRKIIFSPCVVTHNVKKNMMLLLIFFFKYIYIELVHVCFGKRERILLEYFNKYKN